MFKVLPVLEITNIKRLKIFVEIKTRMCFVWNEGLRFCLIFNCFFLISLHFLFLWLNLLFQFILFFFKILYHFFDSSKVISDLLSQILCFLYDISFIQLNHILVHLFQEFRHLETFGLVNNLVLDLNYWLTEICEISLEGSVIMLLWRLYHLIFDE